MSSEFIGFPFKSFQFLQDLRKYNTKDWFEAHRQEYQQFILQPMQALVKELAPVMFEIDPMLEISPAVNKTISRIYRDTRFSKDKSPYKTSQWVTFKRPRREWQNFPAYFFELSPESYRFGMGFYGADRATMDRFRTDLDENPAPFLAAISFYNLDQFSLEGEGYKRPLKSDIQASLQGWYNRKSFYLVCQHSMQPQGIAASFVDELASDFETLAPLYNYLVKVIQP